MKVGMKVKMVLMTVFFFLMFVVALIYLLFSEVISNLGKTAITGILVVVFAIVIMITGALVLWPEKRES